MGLEERPPELERSNVADKSIKTNPSNNCQLSPEKILGAGVIGIVSALAYDIGIALAGGPPPRRKEIIADITSGFLGGAAGEAVIEVSKNQLLGLGVGALLTGLIYQLVIRQLPREPSYRVRRLCCIRPGLNSRLPYQSWIQHGAEQREPETQPDLG